MNNSTEAFSGPHWYFVSVLYAVLSIGALCSSVMILWTHIKVPELWSRHNLILALAFCDGIASISIAQHAAVPWVGPYFFTHRTCAMIEAPYVFQATVSPWVTLALAVVRTIGFKYPMKLAGYTEPNIVIGVYSALVGYGLLIIASMFIIDGESEKVRLCLVTTALAGPGKVIAQLMTVTASLSVIPVNFVLYKEVQKRKKEKLTKSKLDTRLAQSILVVCMVYVATWMVGVTGFVALNLTTTPDGAMNGMYLCFGLLTAGNCGVNYPIYLSRTEDYRRAIGFRSKTSKVYPLKIPPPGHSRIQVTKI